MNSDQPPATAPRTGALAAVLGSVLFACGCGSTTPPAPVTDAAGAVAEANQPTGPAPVTGPERQALATARRFLAGWLAYSYGHGSARQITDTTALLRRQLERTRPRVTDQIRSLRPQLEEPRVVRWHADLGWDITGAVLDGTARHPFTLNVRPDLATGQLVVTTIGS